MRRSSETLPRVANASLLRPCSAESGSAGDQSQQRQERSGFHVGPGHGMYPPDDRFSRSLFHNVDPGREGPEASGWPGCRPPERNDSGSASPNRYRHETLLLLGCRPCGRMSVTVCGPLSKANRDPDPSDVARATNQASGSQSNNRRGSRDDIASLHASFAMRLARVAESSPPRRCWPEPLPANKTMLRKSWPR